ncbi:hypothetical protein ASA1KI_19880 [Opitutales bacterium ASA1]|uniref:hypothetical protein n=1 Tax=Congregicoccus parvus TaxID=3081749 RepID=UPI002B2E7FD2|nr:hypothetical protein ASA1KI_19880 [Opitutales bacterium ASA1]
MNLRTRIRLLATVALVAIAAALVVPRFAGSHEDGLAGATTAALVFFALLLVGLVCGVWSAVATLRHWRLLPVLTRASGLFPLLIVLVVAILFAIPVRTRVDLEPDANTPATPPPTPTAVPPS